MNFKFIIFGLHLYNKDLDIREEVKNYFISIDLKFKILINNIESIYHYPGIIKAMIKIDNYFENIVTNFILCAKKGEFESFKLIIESLYLNNYLIFKAILKCENNVQDFISKCRFYIENEKISQKKMSVDYLFELEMLKKTILNKNLTLFKYLFESSNEKFIENNRGTGNLLCMILQNDDFFEYFFIEGHNFSKNIEKIANPDKIDCHISSIINGEYRKSVKFLINYPEYIKYTLIERIIYLISKSEAFYLLKASLNFFDNNIIYTNMCRHRNNNFIKLIFFCYSFSLETF